MDARTVLCLLGRRQITARTIDATVCVSALDGVGRVRPFALDPLEVGEARTVLVFVDHSRGQQRKVARAEALAFIAPVHFLSFPAILKGWLDRVWTPGFAYDLTADEVLGRVLGAERWNDVERQAGGLDLRLAPGGYKALFRPEGEGRSMKAFYLTVSDVGPQRKVLSLEGG